MAITGAIFDCDGTLLDTLEAWRGLEDHLAELCSISVSPEERAALITYTIPETAAWFHDHGLGRDAQAVIGLMDEWMIAQYRTAALLPGVREFLDKCAQAGVVMSVASSSPVRYLEAGLEAAGIRHHFVAVLSVEELGSTKREPLVYERARNLMGTSAESTWGFEDSAYAMETLHKAGFPVVGLFDGTDPMERIQAAADVVISTFENLELTAFSQ